MKKWLCIMALLLPLCSLYSQEAIPTIRSDSGTAAFRSPDITILVLLLSDYGKTLREWDRPDSEGLPKVETKTAFTTGDTVVPFVVFATKTALAAPLLCDVDLVMPNGDLSPTDKAPGVVLARRLRPDGNLYRQENIFGFGISTKYPQGQYVVRLKIYNAEKVFCYFEETFQLN